MEILKYELVIYRSYKTNVRNNYIFRGFIEKFIGIATTYIDKLAISW